MGDEGTVNGGKITAKAQCRQGNNSLVFISKMREGFASSRLCGNKYLRSDSRARGKLNYRVEFLIFRSIALVE